MNEIEQAIAQRLVLEINYKGGMRLVEPYVLFVDKEDEQLVRVWQIGGYSSTGRIPDWRSFKVASVADARVTRTSFGTGPKTASNFNLLGAVRVLASVEGLSLDDVLSV